VPLRALSLLLPFPPLFSEPEDIHYSKSQRLILLPHTNHAHITLLLSIWLLHIHDTPLTTRSLARVRVLCRSRSLHPAAMSCILLPVLPCHHLSIHNTRILATTLADLVHPDILVSRRRVVQCDLVVRRPGTTMMITATRATIPLTCSPTA
jgi:hypothetical protein